MVYTGLILQNYYILCLGKMVNYLCTIIPSDIKLPQLNQAGSCASI